MPDRDMRAAKRAEKIRKRKKRRLKRALVLIAELLILTALCGVAYLMKKYDKFQTITFDEGEIISNSGIKKDGYTTIALFGGDSRDGKLEKGAHADTIMIASLDHKTKELRLASVYRDTVTEQMNGKLQKANYAYFAGGPKDAINMLNKNFDLNIEDYVTVDFKALADAIDLLGGIELDVTDREAEEVNHYIDETGRVSGKKAVHLTGGGRQTLDGVQAVTYARIRKNVGGDFKRTERQRAVIGKVAEKVKQTKITTMNRIVNQVFPQISTSFSLNELIRLAAGAFEYQISETTGFPMEAANGSVKGLGSVVVPVGLSENVEELHSFLYRNQKYGRPTGTVQEIAAKIEKKTGITRNSLQDEKTNIVRSNYSIQLEETKKQGQKGE